MNESSPYRSSSQPPQRGFVSMIIIMVVVVGAVIYLAYLAASS